MLVTCISEPEDKKKGRQNKDKKKGSQTLSTTNMSARLAAREWLAGFRELPWEEKWRLLARFENGRSTVDVFKTYPHHFRRPTSSWNLPLLAKAITDNLVVEEFYRNIVVIKMKHAKHGCLECLPPCVAYSKTENEKTKIKNSCEYRYGQYAVVSGWHRVAAFRMAVEKLRVLENELRQVVVYTDSMPLEAQAFLVVAAAVA
jgi:hypothetical protein